MSGSEVDALEVSDEGPSACPFCAALLEGSAQVLERGLHVAVLADGFPVSPGHVLVVPLRHVARFGELSVTESQAVLSMLDVTARRLARRDGVDGVNVGWNDGAAAGQTVPHVHAHVIPRRFGDVDDPRGGVRNVVPHKARYW